MTGFPLAQQRRLLDIQELDTRADVLDQRWRAHPGVEALRELTARSHEAEADLEPAEQGVADGRARVRDAEREAEQIRAHQARDQKRLDAGTVSSPRELQSLQHEIATLQQKLDDVETRELEAMEELDGAELGLAQVRASLATIASSREEHEHELTSARVAIDADREAVAAERASIVAELPDGLVERYERSRANHGGVGVGALRHGRCEGCRLALTPADRARLSAAPEDELVQCEECGRLLVRVEDA
jgi:predicted  nucleic acid-binding Zn-ribbon protein